MDGEKAADGASLPGAGGHGCGPPLGKVGCGWLHAPHAQAELGEDMKSAQAAVGRWGE